MLQTDPITPRLQSLVLDEEELAALRHNGSVHAEEHRGRPVYKLRFRVGGVQHVRSLGRDPAAAAALREELALWQLDHRDQLDIAKVVKFGRGVLRQAKLRLEPQVEAAGYHFHGRDIRQRRASAKTQSGPPRGR